jgi:hypothetical protein
MSLTEINGIKWFQMDIKMDITVGLCNIHAEEEDDVVDSRPRNHSASRPRIADTL